MNKFTALQSYGPNADKIMMGIHNVNLQIDHDQCQSTESYLYKIYIRRRSDSNE